MFEPNLPLLQIRLFEIKATSLAPGHEMKLLIVQHSLEDVVVLISTTIDLHQFEAINAGGENIDKGKKPKCKAYGIRHGLECFSLRPASSGRKKSLRNVFEIPKRWGC